MDNELRSTLESLRQALALSPENVPLRNLYVDNLLKAGGTEEVVAEITSLIRLYPDDENLRLRLAEVYAQRQEFGIAIVLIEDLVHKGQASPETIKLYARLLVEENQMAAAAKVYNELIRDEKQTRDTDLEAKLSDWFDSPEGVSEEPDDEIPAGLIENPTIKFEDVGGMAGVKEEIAFKIIRPIQHKELFSAYGKKAGGGILMYGPPGCGKTFISRATAGETGSTFISIGIHDILNMWMGESESRLHAIFDYARNHTPAVLFFDEADALGASRRDMKHNPGRTLINQFLMELDGDRYSNDDVLVLASTNTPWNIDSAFMRPGRFDNIIFVPPPDYEARIAILEILLRDKPVKDIDYQGLAKKTEGFSGADLAGLVDTAVENLLREVLKSGTEKPLTGKDLNNAVKSVRSSTRDWFATARNYVMYSNESGLYNPVAEYLKMKL